MGEGQGRWEKVRDGERRSGTRTHLRVAIDLRRPLRRVATRAAAYGRVRLAQEVRAPIVIDEQTGNVRAPKGGWPEDELGDDPIAEGGAVTVVEEVLTCRTVTGEGGRRWEIVGDCGRYTNGGEVEEVLTCEDAERRRRDVSSGVGGVETSAEERADGEGGRMRRWRFDPHTGEPHGCPPQSHTPPVHTPSGWGCVVVGTAGVCSWSWYKDEHLEVFSAAHRGTCGECTAGSNRRNHLAYAGSSNFALTVLNHGSALAMWSRCGAEGCRGG